MAPKAGLFIAPVLESGGTNALTGTRSGALVSIGGSAPLVLPSLGVVYTGYVRTIDDVTGDDPEQDSTSNVIVIPPSHMQVCATYSGTFTSSPLDLGVACIGGNQPFYMKQTDLADAASASLVIGALSWTAGTRVAQVGTVTPTPGNGQVALAYDAISGAAGYEVQRAADGDFSSGVVTVDVGNSTSPAITGLTNDVLRFFRVRAYAATGAAAWSASVSATPSQYAYLAEFTGTAGTTTLPAGLQEATLGSPTVQLDGAGHLAIASNGASQCAVISTTGRLVAAAAHTYKTKFCVLRDGAPNTDYAYVLCLMDTAGMPVYSDDGVANRIGFVASWESSSSSYLIQSNMQNTSGTFLTWNTATSAWVTSGGASYRGAAGTYYTAIIETTATQFRLTLMDAGESTIYSQTAWTNFSSAKAFTNGAWPCFGDVWTGGNTHMLVDRFSVE